MGFRAVTDLSEYSTEELLKLISQAADIVRARVSGETSESSSVPEPASASSGEPRVADGVALKNPLTCPYRCRHCNEQCYRVTSHVLHSCAEHKHLR